MSFIIEDVKREGAKFVLGLAGVSGCGKTYTALQIGYGMAKNNAKKLALLDTENGRGKLYDNILPERFRYSAFIPPFSPARYIQGIQAIENAGCEVLVIDSGTHEWEGAGGCEEIATGGDPKLPRWNKAKLEHKRFMNVLLQSSMHIILCLRAREKVKVIKGVNPENGKFETYFEQQGLQPICEKNMMFEMTASLLLHDEGTRQETLKCPDALRKILGRKTGYLTAKDGFDLRAWIDGALPIDPETEARRIELSRGRTTLSNACEGGKESLRLAWESLPIPLKHRLKDEIDQYKAAALEYDRQREIENGHDPEDDETMSAVGKMLGKQSAEDLEKMPDLM